MSKYHYETWITKRNAILEKGLIAFRKKTNNGLPYTPFELGQLAYLHNLKMDACPYGWNGTEISPERIKWCEGYMDMLYEIECPEVRN